MVARRARRRADEVEVLAGVFGWGTRSEMGGEEKRIRWNMGRAGQWAHMFYPNQPTS